MNSETLAVERDADDVREALRLYGEPDELMKFDLEREYGFTEERFTEWWATATSAANPPTERDREMMRRLFEDGDDTGFYIQNDDGSFTLQ
ncbi:hypothetical protein SAMN04487904_102277 [Actinopolyspora lacussalsi subsp. righensis]|uniref:Uncharacterized protein n=1 Tax=Actinopolyspora righensis TaxID=995060 RepID=A0A1I6Y7U7_9ACTN|nr:hypothetical protein [Actinopolyspora righensis]SFT46467.1 hypothetical protein SAMN04487904_102277 [Actinopolyspora righensis]